MKKRFFAVFLAATFLVASAALTTSFVACTIDDDGDTTGSSTTSSGGSTSGGSSSASSSTSSSGGEIISEALEKAIEQCSVLQATNDDACPCTSGFIGTTGLCCGGASVEAGCKLYLTKSPSFGPAPNIHDLRVSFRGSQPISAPAVRVKSVSLSHLRGATTVSTLTVSQSAKTADYVARFPKISGDQWGYLIYHLRINDENFPPQSGEYQSEKWKASIILNDQQQTPITCDLQLIDGTRNVDGALAIEPKPGCTLDITGPDIIAEGGGKHVTVNDRIQRDGIQVNIAYTPYGSTRIPQTEGPSYLDAATPIGWGPSTLPLVQGQASTYSYTIPPNAIHLDALAGEPYQLFDELKAQVTGRFGSKECGDPLTLLAPEIDRCPLVSTLTREPMSLSTLPSGGDTVAFPTGTVMGDFLPTSTSIFEDNFGTVKTPHGNGWTYEFYATLDTAGNGTKGVLFSDIGTIWYRADSKYYLDGMTVSFYKESASVGRFIIDMYGVPKAINLNGQTIYTPTHHQIISENINPQGRHHLAFVRSPEIACTQVNAPLYGEAHSTQFPDYRKINYGLYLYYDGGSRDISSIPFYIPNGVNFIETLPLPASLTGAMAVSALPDNWEKTFSYRNIVGAGLYFVDPTTETAMVGAESSTNLLYPLDFGNYFQGKLQYVRTLSYVTQAHIAAMIADPQLLIPQLPVAKYVYSWVNPACYEWRNYGSGQFLVACNPLDRTETKQIQHLTLSAPTLPFVPFP